jgi:hypothetical protein
MTGAIPRLLDSVPGNNAPKMNTNRGHTLHQRGYDGTRIEYVNSANQNATQYSTGVNQANRETGDGMASISMQQGRESAGAAYAASGTSIAGHRTAQSLNDQATRVESPAESPALK